MDKDKAILELYTCLLKASGCIGALEGLSSDLSLESVMPGLPRVRKEVDGCLDRYRALHQDLEAKRIVI